MTLRSAQGVLLAVVAAAAGYAIVSTVQSRRATEDRGLALQDVRARLSEVAGQLAGLEARIDSVERSCATAAPARAAHADAGRAPAAAPSLTAVEPQRVPTRAERPAAGAVPGQAQGHVDVWSIERSTYRDVASSLGIAGADLARVDALAEKYQAARRAVAKKALPPMEQRRLRDAAARDFHYALEDVLGVEKFNEFRSIVTSRIGGPRDLP